MLTLTDPVGLAGTNDLLPTLTCLTGQGKEEQHCGKLAQGQTGLKLLKGFCSFIQTKLWMAPQQQICW